MKLLSKWFPRKRDFEQFMSEELRFHLEQQTGANMKAGMMPDEARRQARLQLGALESVKEGCREERRGFWLESWWADLRFALRMLRKSPGFTIVAVFTLALGIGANTAIFSVVNAVLLKPLPYPGSDRLVRIYSTNVRSGGDHWMNSSGDIETARQRASAFQGVAFFQEGAVELAGVAEPEELLTVSVSQDFFSVLGVSATEGRTFLLEDFTANHDQAVVISNSLRRRVFGNAAAVGQTISLDGRLHTVVGVMPVGFHYPGTESDVKTDVWLPWTGQIDASSGNRELAAIARLKPSVTLRQVATELNAIHSALEREYPNDADWRLRLVSLQGDLHGGVRLALLVVFGAVGFVLLIACTNVANLLLARAATRRTEMAVRTALGARRSRLIRQLLTESTLLALVGAGAGLVMAIWGVRVIRSIETTDIPRLAEVQLSGNVLLFTLPTAVFVGLLFGLAPALRASRSSFAGRAREELGSGRGGTRHRALNRVLLVSQLTLSLVLLVGAGLMVKSFLRLTSVDLGFRPDHLLTFSMGLSGAKYTTADSRATFYRETLDKIGALPGVDSAALASSLALTGSIGVTVQIDGAPRPGQGPPGNAAYQAVSPDYFRAMRVPLIKGRYLSREDVKGAPPVVVVNLAFVKQFLPTGEPLGHRVYISMASSALREIVGVVGDVREDSLDQTPTPEVYLPIFQAWVAPGAAYIVRTRVEPLGLAQSIRGVIQQADKDQPIAEVQTMDHIVYSASARPRFLTDLLSLFSLLALVLTAVGLYGVTAYLVSQRTHEIGVRMALGASASRILWLVFRESAWLIAVGMSAGLAGALALSRFLQSLLFEIKPTDPATYVGVSLMLAIVAFAACYFPARRAMRVDPMVALRYE